MSKLIVAVYDKKAESFNPIYTSKNEAVAVRDFSQGCIDKESNLSKYPEDYALYKLGTVEEDTGIITPTKIKKEINGETIELIQPEKLVEANLFKEAK